MDCRYYGNLFKRKIMRKKYLDRTGIRYGRLVALAPVEQFTINNKRKWAWHCRCDCGNEIVTRADNLGNGQTKSCGCLKIEVSKMSIIDARKNNTKHGDYKSNIYKLYHCIKGRVKCKRPRDARNYKDRGITICDEWEKDYLSFKRWALDNGYKKGLQIDRIDGDKGYYPSNCRFVTPLENARNKKRYTKPYTFTEKKSLLS